MYRDHFLDVINRPISDDDIDYLLKAAASLPDTHDRTIRILFEVNTNNDILRNRLDEVVKERRKHPIGVLAEIWYSYFFRRGARKDVTRVSLNELAKMIDRKEKMPRTEICAFIKPLTPYDPRYVEELVQDKYKDPEMSRRGKLGRRTSSPEVEPQVESPDYSFVRPYCAYETASDLLEYPFQNVIEAGEEAIMSQWGTDIEAWNALETLRDMVAKQRNYELTA